MEHRLKLFYLTVFAVTFFQLHHYSLQKEEIKTKGTLTNVGNLSIYETEFTKKSTVALIAVHDIFGLHPHIQYVADEIAAGENGIRVIMPDFFHGVQLYDPDTFPTPNYKSESEELFKPEGMWTKTVKADLKNVIEHYKSKGIVSFGIFGFCWGGKISVYAASDSDFSTTIKVAGLVHPSQVTTEDADHSQCPMILLPSKDEPDMIPFFNKLESVFKGQSEHKRFSDMPHGFAGAKSDFNNATVKLRVEETIQLLKSYFGRMLQQQTTNSIKNGGNRPKKQKFYLFMVYSSITFCVFSLL